MIRPLTKSDIPVWLEIAREVEPLFGPMVNSYSFKETIRWSIVDEDAFGIENENSDLVGVISIERPIALVSWLAVKESERGKGYGRQLLKKAIEELNSDVISVRTFSKDAEGGTPARSLYISEGFKDHVFLGRNHVGLPMVLMKRQ